MTIDPPAATSHEPVQGNKKIADQYANSEHLDIEDETIRAEEDAQKAYEDFVKDTNNSIEAKSKDIINKSENKAKAESNLVETKESKEAAMLELEQKENNNFSRACDLMRKRPMQARARNSRFSDTRNLKNKLNHVFKTNKWYK